jgi:hypothetical protein
MTSQTVTFEYPKRSRRSLEIRSAVHGSLANERQYDLCVRPQDAVLTLMRVAKRWGEAIGDRE